MNPNPTNTKSITSFEKIYGLSGLMKYHNYLAYTLGQKT